MRIYIQDKEYEIAEANGITKHNVWQRVYEYGWDVERAITQPVKNYKKRNWNKWQEVAEEHGVTANVFYLRVSKKNMTPKEAATTPIAKPGDNLIKYREKQRLLKQG